MTYSSEVLADSPELYLRLGESSGTAAVDASGNGRDGTYANTPTLGVAGALAGDADTAVTFTAASNEDVSVAWFANLDSSTWTIECWVKTTASNQAIVGRSGTTGAPYSMFVGASGEALVGIKYSGTAGDNYAGTAVINDGNWHHVVAVRSGAGTNPDLWIYVDGVLDASFDSVTPKTGSGFNFRVASRGGTPYLNGSVDEVAFYSTALTSTRIAAHYAAGTADPTVNLTPADTAHTHAVESPAFTQTHELAPADTTHAHAVESPALTQVHELTPADVAHAHTVEAPALTQTHELTPADALHTHAIESTTVSVDAVTLTPADATHGHTVETPALTQIHQLIPFDATHAHTVDAPLLAQTHELAPLDAIHAHTVDSATVTPYVATPTPATRTSTAATSPRTSTARASSRTSTATASSRTSSN